MQITTKERAAVNQSRIFLYGKNQEIGTEYSEVITNELHLFFEIKQDLLPDSPQPGDFLFLLIEGYSRENVHFIKKICHSYMDDNTLSILLVHKEELDRRGFQYLSLPISGIVSLPYLLKHCQRVIEAVWTNGIFLEPQKHRELVLEIERKKMKDMPIKRLVLKRDICHTLLSQNERDVLQLILEGHNNQKIAKLLYLAPSTVSTIISHLLRKMQANDRTDAMVKAIRTGWVEAQR
ncbi:two-component system, NarL family, response regulator DegU [Evansella caseinilytica]|uniref:Two-component system, NarL family, response regulator DegU n=1 Tax=Evansella caseinilytica TaxID=1503961 RepID=A0A1H3S6F1_9BACI|nr:LuxR C-terminal-related transcriptional regulator [Evansella caseinilytica]SDZ33484.1 two-component system, NarL family, response regulator DegU [Evansella caseinilytica]